jgi:mono/diheme cytochrome c family protein
MLSPRTVLLGALLIPSITPAQHEGVAPTPTTPAPKVDFARHVRPILAQHCYTCHGPDDKQRKGKLRLDRAEFAFAPRDNGPAFVASDPEHSEALLRVLSSDPDQILRIPPTSRGQQRSPSHAREVVGRLRSS